MCCGLLYGNDRLLRIIKGNSIKLCLQNYTIRIDIYIFDYIIVRWHILCYCLSMSGMPSKGNLTPEQFVLRAIERLRKPPYKGIHSVFSGFNQAFRDYFPLLDPVEVTNQLAKDGKIVMRPAKKGVILYRAGDVESPMDTATTIKKIENNL